MRARDLLGRFAAWRCRRKPYATGAAPPSFPIVAYNAALDRMVELARAAGAAEERARIVAIVRLPKAERFPRLALSLALSGTVGAEQALEALGAADLDAPVLHPPTPDMPAAESGRRLLH